MAPDPLPVMRFESARAWEEWLSTHHGTSPGLWLQIAKKGASAATINYEEALTVALCYGWIDGQKGRLDDDYWLQRFSPRKPGSRWSKLNVERVTLLIDSGQIQPAGLAEVDRAKADGRWEQAYEPQSRSTVPDDFAEALAADERARDFFATLDSANRYAILYRIGAARSSETRAKRIATFIEMLSAHQKIHN